MWPFKQKPKSVNDLPPVSAHEGKWSVAMGEIEDGPVIVRKNETAKRWAKHPDLPVKLGFAVPLNTPNPGGLPMPDENEQLDEIEDVVSRTLDDAVVGIPVMVITTGQMKEFIFYIREGADIAALHEKLMQLVTTHEIQCIAEMEREWDTFFAFG